MRRKSKRRATLLRLEGLEARSLLTTLIALVDTGVDLTPTDASYINDSKYYDLSLAYNAYDGSTNVADNNGHGTVVANNTVAGIQAVLGQAGAAGNAANVQILPIRDTDNSGNLNINAIINGICYAADEGAAVINLSFAGPTNFSSSASDTLHPNMSLSAAIQYAQAKGSVVVVAAGNSGDSISGTQYGNQDIDNESPYPVEPAALGYDDSLTNEIVTAAFNTSTDSLQSDSNYGPLHVAVATPGAETSFAAAYLSGVIGGIAGLRPDFSASQLINRVESTVQTYSSLTGLVGTGGVVDPAAAVAGLLGPTVVTPATASTTTVTGTTVGLSVLGGDAAGASTLTYQWQTISAPAGTNPAFSVNDSNAANHTTATFSSAGNYTFQVTMTDGDGATATSSVAVTVAQTPTALTLSPTSPTVADGGTQTFTAGGVDQFHLPFASLPSLTWSLSPGGVGGTISPAGLYTAPASGTGTETITATLGSIQQTATVTVTSPPPQAQVATVVTATSLGQDGVDMVGNGPNSGQPDGYQDIDILLSGLPASKTIVYIQVFGYGGGEWQYDAQNGPSPHNSDAAALVRTPGATTAHLYVSPYENETGRPYEVKVLYNDGSTSDVYTNPVYATYKLPMPSTAPAPATTPAPTVVTATSLGQDGVDMVGNGPNSGQPDGYQDIDILLSGLPASKTIVYIQVFGYGGGEWQYDAQNGPSPHNSDVAALVRAPGATTAHLYVSPYENETGRPYEVKILYSDGSTSDAYTNPVYATYKLPMPSTTPAPAPTVVTATSLGQDGVDMVGNGSNSGQPDGYQDIDILLSGLPASKTIVYIQVFGYGGGEWQYDAQNGPSPHRSDAAALVRARGATTAHLYVSPYENETGRPYEVKILYSDGSTSDVYTNPVYATYKLPMP